MSRRRLSKRPGGEAPLLDVRAGEDRSLSPCPAGLARRGSKNEALAAAILAKGGQRGSFDAAAPLAGPGRRRPSMDAAVAGLWLPSLEPFGATRRPSVYQAKPEPPAAPPSAGVRRTSLRAAAVAVSLCNRLRPKVSADAAPPLVDQAGEAVPGFEMGPSESSVMEATPSAVDMLTAVLQEQKDEFDALLDLGKRRASEQHITDEIDGVVSSLSLTAQCQSDFIQASLGKTEYWS